MKYSRGQFTKAYYQLWQSNLPLPQPSTARTYSVKFRKNQFDEPFYEIIQKKMNFAESEDVIF